MTGQQILDFFRDLTNDKGSNPFVTDARWRTDYLLMWQTWVASRLRWPLAEQTQAYVAGGTDTALAAAVMQIEFVQMEYTSPSRTDILTGTSEEELREIDPNFRNAANGKPSKYYISNAVTEGATTTRTLKVNPPADSSCTLRIIYVQRPAAIASLSISPVAPEVLHMSAAFFTASLAMRGRDPQIGAAFWQDFLNEFNTNKREAMELIRDMRSHRFAFLGSAAALGSSADRLSRFDY